MALAIAFELAVGAAAESIAGTDLEAAELIADLPWAFEVTIEPAGERPVAPQELWSPMDFEARGPLRRTDPATGPVRFGRIAAGRRP